MLGALGPGNESVPRRTPALKEQRVSFYDDIAADYDRIVGGAKRAAAAEGFVAWLAGSRPLRRALEVACGTGLYARALGRRDIEVVAADVSEAMLQQAKAQTTPADGRIEWLAEPMQTIAQHVAGPFDAVLCMGNSLPHLLSDADLRAALEAFRAVLAESGVVVIHLLNYARVLARRERIVGVTREGDREYVRFYDFLPERVQFNILELHWEGGACRHELHQTTLRPYTAGQLKVALARAGFAAVELYNGPAVGPFSETESDQLLLVAR